MEREYPAPDPSPTRTGHEGPTLVGALMRTEVILVEGGMQKTVTQATATTFRLPQIISWENPLSN